MLIRPGRGGLPGKNCKRARTAHWTLEFDGTTVTVYRPDGTQLVVAGDTETDRTGATRGP
jgi:hypothetical protein